MKIYRIPRLCLTNDNLRALGLQYVPVVKNGRGLKSYRSMMRLQLHLPEKMLISG